MGYIKPTSSCYDTDEKALDDDDFGSHSLTSGVFHENDFGRGHLLEIIQLHLSTAHRKIVRHVQPDLKPKSPPASTF